MPDIKNVYADADAMELPDLHARREALLASAPMGDTQLLSDDALSELLAVNRALRRKVATSGASRRTAAPKKKTKATLDDLL